MNKTLSTLVGASVLTTGLMALVPQQAQALTSIYLGNGFDLPDIDDEFIYSKDGISVTATGSNLANGEVDVWRSLLGLGVYSPGDTIINGGTQIEGGINAAETLQLNFNTVVSLKSVTFSRVGRNDSFKLIVDGDQFTVADIPDGNLLDLDISQFTFNPAPTGTGFGFTINDNNDDYLLKYVDVHAVPEPLTLLGSGIALGFGSFLRRKLDRIKQA